jgi:hypothetical protein
MVKSCTRNHLNLKDKFKLIKEYDAKATMVALTKKYKTRQFHCNIKIKFIVIYLCSTSSKSAFLSSFSE